MAGVGALLLTHPLDTVRTRLAAARIFADELSYRGFMDCVRQTWHRGGVAGLYVGCLASMLEIAPYTAIAFTSYEGLKQRLLPGTTTQSSSIWCRRVFAGLCSGVAATTFCYPLDTVRRQLMLDGALGFDSRYNGSIWQCCRYLWSQGGILPFYRGWTVTLMKSVPSVSITFLTKDMLLSELGRFT